MCHTGSVAPNFPIAGTLYDSLSGGKAISGATITAVDSNGKEIKMTTKSNGNFWTTTSNIAWPVQVRASSCPSLVEMVSPVAQASGDCNSCHNSSFRIYLP
jgi:hypothetical protein